MTAPLHPNPANYGWGLPLAASTFAGEIDFGIYLIHAAMILIFVLWGIFFAYLLVRYRAKPGVPAEGGEEHESIMGLMPDFAVMLFEIGLIVFYAIPSWSRIKMHVPDGPDTNHMEVVAEQFAWNAHYPGPDGKLGRRKAELVHFTNPIGLDPTDPDSKDDIYTANELHMPNGVPTVMQLVSKDVIHSFFVPEFRLKQDAMPGMRIPVWVQPTQTGVFEIGCAQLCGFGHALMRGAVVVDSPEDFKTWLKGKAVPAKAAEKKEEW